MLRKKARPVKQISGTVRKLVADMFETMYAGNGVGLAAPQVGVSKRIFVLDTREIGQKIAMINPRIISSIKKELVPEKEGCLSLPEMEVEVPRARKISVEYTDIDGRIQTLEAEDLLARAIQHENDHLDGILIIDYARKSDRERLLRQMEELEAGVHA